MSASTSLRPPKRKRLSRDSERRLPPSRRSSAQLPQTGTSPGSTRKLGRANAASTGAASTDAASMSEDEEDSESGADEEERSQDIGTGEQDEASYEDEEGEEEQDEGSYEDEEDTEDEEDEETRLKKEMRSLSFSALLSAQTQTASSGTSSQYSNRKRSRAQNTDSSDSQIAMDAEAGSDQDRDGDRSEARREREREREREQKAQLLRERLAELRQATSKHRRDQSHRRDQPDTSTEKETIQNVRGPRNKDKKEGPGKDTNARRAKKDAQEASSRASKHAPTEQPSNKPVSRRRLVVDTSSSFGAQSLAIQTSDPAQPGRRGGRSSGGIRDPRFAPAVGGVNHAAHAKQYSFLTEYRASEIGEIQGALAGLRARARKRKSGALTADEEDEKARLRRLLDSLSNKQRAIEEADRERRVKAAFRAEERAKLRAGDKARPFFPKRAALRARLHADRTAGMSDKQKAAVERKSAMRKSKREKKAVLGLGLGPSMRG